MISKLIFSGVMTSLLAIHFVESATVDSLKSEVNESVTATAHPTNESPAERAISDKIRTLISKDNRFSNAARKIQIATQGSIVTLSGQVNSEAEKIRIKAIAQNMEGVTAVMDHVTVKTAAPNR